MKAQTLVIKLGTWGCILALTTLCSACAPTTTASVWDKNYEGVVSVSRVPNLGPSAGIF